MARPIIFLVPLAIAYFVVPPILRRRREKLLAERLKKVHDPLEAMAMVDAATREGKKEGQFLEWARIFLRL